MTLTRRSRIGTVTSQGSTSWRDRHGYASWRLITLPLKQWCSLLVFSFRRFSFALISWRVASLPITVRYWLDFSALALCRQLGLGFLHDAGQLSKQLEYVQGRHLPIETDATVLAFDPRLLEGGNGLRIFVEL